VTSAQSAPVFINGRFLAQPLSGVQRFAMETTQALIRRADRLNARAPMILTPPLTTAARAGAPAGFPITEVGRRQGQAWEQCDLPGQCRAGLLVNLGNTAPLLIKRQIVVIHDSGVFRRPEAYSAAFRLWYAVLQRLLVLRGVRIVTVSEFSRQEIVYFLNCDPGQIAVIGESGHHARLIAPDTSVLAANGLQPGRFVLAVGNLAAHKNLAALGETARQLAERHLQLVITGGLDRGVFGNAPGRLPHPATYLGRVSDAALTALYQTAACFVFPSTYEGFGLPALEAMENDCPVVAARIPALQEICGDAAEFCDPLDPADIAAAVIRVASDSSLAAGLRSRGQACSLTHTWDRTAERLSAVIDEMVAGTAA
jgi:glycosyltransferase involved in cell wall biosynthesis